MQFEILTIFPDLIHHYAGESILGRAQQKGLISVKAHNFRAWTLDKHQHVDEHPYGGGPGMVLQVEPIYRCLESLGLVENGKKVKSSKTKVVIMDPAGKKFDQRMAEKFSKLERLVFITGRYEGFDERVYKFVDEKISVGDYVLAGGELPALSIVEAVSRLIPGVLGNKDSIKEETHTIGTEYPQYTRPENFMGMKVPKVLLSGNHDLIKKWREEMSKSLPGVTSVKPGRKKNSK